MSVVGTVPSATALAFLHQKAIEEPSGLQAGHSSFMCSELSPAELSLDGAGPSGEAMGELVVDDEGRQGVLQAERAALPGVEAVVPDRLEHPDRPA